jgi:hypothetical protein
MEMPPSCLLPDSENPFRSVNFHIRKPRDDPSMCHRHYFSCPDQFINPFNGISRVLFSSSYIGIGRLLSSGRHVSDGIHPLPLSIIGTTMLVSSGLHVSDERILSHNLFVVI